MKGYFLLYTVVIVLFSSIVFSQSYTLNGDASYLSGDCYQLTPDASDMYGTVWYSNQLDLSEPFDITFRAYLGTADATGADGMVFVLQTVGNTAMGVSGDGMGYSGFSPSLGVEFDTYDNTWSPQANEMDDHIAISINGDIANPIAGPIQASPFSTNIELDIEHPVRVTWDPVTQLIEVYFDCDLRLTTNYDLINNIFGGNTMVYWGFTAATGGYHNEHRVCVETNVITVPDTVYVCEGSSVLLDATGSATNVYSWGPNYNISGANTQQPTVWPMVDTTYYVTYTDYCNFDREDSIRVIVNPIPQPNLGNDTIICPGNSLTINAGTYTSYLWDGAQTTQTININTANNYIVTVTDNNGCEGIDDVNVTIGTLPTVDAGNNSQICIGGSVNLTVNSSTAASYLWSTSETTQTVTVSPVLTTTYTITVTDVNLCSNSDDVTVNVATSLLVDLGNDTSICVGSSIGIAANGGIIFNWASGETTQIINVTPVIGTSTYTVTVSDGATCTGTDDINITVNALPNISAGVDENICIGDNINLTANGGAVYSWSTGDNTQVVNVSPASLTLYTVTGIDANGCINTDDVNVNVHALPNIDIGADLIVCENNSVDISSNISGTYVWSTGETTESIHVSPMVNQTISVTVTDVNSCSNSDALDISVITGINVTITPDLSDCPGYPVSLTVSGGTGYVWSTNETSSTININTPNIPTYYSVTVSDASTCFGYDSVLVTPYQIPNADAGANEQICTGASVSLSATGGVQYQWSTGDNSNSIIVNPTNTTTYVVTVTDANGCENSDNVTVNVYAPLQVELEHSPSAVCPGENVVLTANISGGGQPPYMITLNDGTVVSPPLIIQPQDTTVITLHVANSFCPGEVVVSEEIPVYYVPDPNFTSSVTRGCEPLMVSFNSLDNESGLIYQWNFGNLGINYSNTKEPIHVYEGEGVFDVTLKLTTAQGCFKEQTVSNMITVYPKPEAKFIANPTVISSLKPVVQFIDLSSLGYNTNWYFGDGDTSNLISPYHTYKTDGFGEFIVKQVSKTEYGCTDTAKTIIKVQDISSFYVPTAFSPDGDDINDVFIVQAYGIQLDSYSMLVYDQWGEVIYENTDLFSGWDGSVKGNKIAKPGVYVWLVVYKDYSGIEFSKAGTVTLIR